MESFAARYRESLYNTIEFMTPAEELEYLKSKLDAEERKTKAKDKELETFKKAKDKELEALQKELAELRGKLLTG